MNGAPSIRHGTLLHEGVPNGMFFLAEGEGGAAACLPTLAYHWQALQPCLQDGSHPAGACWRPLSGLMHGAVAGEASAQPARLLQPVSVAAQVLVIRRHVTPPGTASRAGIRA